MIKLPKYADATEISQRNEELADNKKKYPWEYNYEALPGVPMAGPAYGNPLEPVALDQLPPPGWIAPVVKRGLELLANDIFNDNQPGRSSEFGGHFSILRMVGLDPRDAFKLLHDVEPQNLVNTLTNLATMFTIPPKPVRPKDLKDYDELYRVIDEPKISKSFRDDAAFALMRVAGQNPVVIEKVKNHHSIGTPTFPVTDEMLKAVPGCEDDSLAEAIQDGRLFICDYAVLAKLANGQDGKLQKYGCAPKALFVVPQTKSKNLEATLLPVAIQTGQVPGDGVQLFTPADGEAWETAKSFVQTADFSHHEIITHLALTHLQMERFAVASYRCLPSSHPLHALLMPHFQGTLFINWAAQLALVNDGGPFEKMFYGTMVTNRALVGTALAWNFNDEIFPEKLKGRGVDTSSALQYYPYRDDGMLVWNALHQWVSDYLDLYYENNAAVAEDTELQGWADEIVNAGLLAGFGNSSTNGQRIQSKEYLVKAVTQIIFTGSAQHAAVNFPQSDFSGYPPAMAASIFKNLPVKDPSNFQDWLDHLPPLNLAELQILVTHILTATIYGKLGSYDRDTFKDPAVRPALHKFRMALYGVDHEIRMRIRRDSEAGIKLEYRYLLPDNIPSSINI